MSRVRHGYGKTRSDQVMGITGMGTVLIFSTLRYAAYPYRGIVGISWVH